MFENPIILIIVVAAALLRWLWQKSQAESQDSERPTVPGEPIPRSGDTQTEEERIRRFLEALGQPATSTPPRKVTPKRQVVETLKPLSEPVLPPLVTIPPPLPSVPISTVIPPPIPIPLMEEPVFKPAMVQEAGFEVRDLGAQTSIDLLAATEQQSFLLKLRSAQGLRDAIVLREIFGPPRSLQTLEIAM